MPWIKESLPRRVWSAFTDFFHRWWKEATLPLGKSGLSPARAWFRRIMLWVPVVILAGVLVGALGLQFFIGWRARDLARKAWANVEQGNLNMARVQITSARSLRPDDPEVLRALAAIETKIGSAGAMETWQKLPPDLVLTPDELEMRAVATMRGGDDGQFGEALAALEKAGGSAQASMLRAERKLSRGNLQDAILETRAAVKISNTPADRLALVRLLLNRHARFLSAPSPGAENLAAAREIFALVDSLEGTQEGEEAIALALGMLNPAPDDVRRWSDAAWKRPSADNPALLAAATAMIATGQAAEADTINRLKVAYTGADPARKAAFAAWLAGRGEAEDALVFAPQAEATRNPSVFLTRAAALGALGKCDELLALSESTGSVPRSLKLAVATQANAKLDRGAQAEQSAKDAVRAAVEEGTWMVTLGILDEAGFRKAADAEIIALCGEAETADAMLQLARQRFTRSGQPASLQSAFEAAAAASPRSPTVEDLRRYGQLLSGEAVDLEETSAALAAAPSDVNLRFTHALALLKAGRSSDALAVFDDFDVFVEQSPPGQQAVAAAIFAANGKELAARGLAVSLDAHLLAPGEFALIAPLRMDTPAKPGEE